MKSNRLALMWALPFGAGLALFADDLVHQVLGGEWNDAVVILQATGIAAAISQIGFNWTAYCRALDDTRPIGVATVVQSAVFVMTIPLFYVYGFDGYALSVMITTVAALIVRGAYLARIFRGFAIVPHTLRAVVPCVPATAAVLAVRLLEGDMSRGVSQIVGELLVFAALVAATTLIWERVLLREATTYLRSRSGVVGSGATLGT